MKRKIFTLALALFSSVGAFAQLQAGSVAPNFIMKDLNGNTYDLYTILNSGKTVFIDVSAAWCGPCWSYHNSGNLENLYKQHGPTGAPNVNASTTNDVMVLMIEGESTNTRAQLYGPAASTGSYATTTQGDWVTGTPYPIIDTNAAATTAFNTAWKISYFPTIYMVCRDHLVQEVGQLTTAALYAKATGVCPTYAPSATVDAKTVPYTGGTYYVCNANPTVRFQNYGAQPISSATIKTYSGTNLVNTYAWSGTAVAPYGIANVTIPAFAGTTYDNYNYEVVVAGDTKASNNVSGADPMYRVYTASSAVTTPWSENFEASANLPLKMTSSAEELRAFQSQGSYTLKGINGATTRGLLFPFPEVANNTVTEIVLGNFNTSAATNVTLEFDYSHYSASTKTDKLEVKASKDCGATWATLWSKSGTALSTTTNAPAGAFVPTVGADWRHDAVSLTAQKGNNMVVKVVGTGNQGHYAFMDNIKITNTLSVANVVANGSVSVYPNPARESATLEFTMSNTSKVVVSVIDALGRTVSVVTDATLQQGAQHINIPTSSLAAGVYNIAIRTE
jgi:hypothetical protein